VSRVARAPRPPRPCGNGGTWQVIALCLAAGCAVLLAAGCGGGSRGAAGIAAGHSTPATAAAAAADRRVLAARYLAIAREGNHVLDRNFDALDGPARDDLAAARSDLRAIAAAERLFDRRLAGIAFPSQIEKTARRLISANQARAALTRTAASAPSLRQLLRDLPRLAQANKPVEAAVRLIRGQLGLPPPQTS
jgi:hypothetical protein